MIEARIVDEKLKAHLRKTIQFLGHPCRKPDYGISFSTGSLNGLAHPQVKHLKECNLNK